MLGLKFLFKHKIHMLSVFILFVFVLSLSSPAHVQEQSKPPKNVIIMISDGCGYYHVDAASLYQYGETGIQVYEKFPVKLGVATYSSDGHGYDPSKAWKTFNYVMLKATDSAAAASAMSTGVKTYNGAIGVDTDKKPVKNSFEYAEEKGRATGVVSSVLFSHATPAAFVAHNKARGKYEQIAKEMILSSKTDVIMGAGNPWYYGNGRKRRDSGVFKYVGGEETWNSLLSGTAGADADGDGTADPWKLIQKRSDFTALKSGETPDRVIGIPMVYNTLQTERDGDNDAKPYEIPLTDTVPTLAEMTSAALNVLDNDPDGFYLMIEGGAIDWASHGGQSGRMIEEEIDFNKSVEAVVNWIESNSSWDETLLIVTGDHETGYLAGKGSGAGYRGLRPVWKPLRNKGKGKQPGMKWYTKHHSNSLIPLYAKGAGSELFKKYIKGTDKKRGDFIHNTGIGQLMISLLK